jgi:hypothetical protein
VKQFGVGLAVAIAIDATVGSGGRGGRPARGDGAGYEELTV